MRFRCSREYGGRVCSHPPCNFWCQVSPPQTLSTPPHGHPLHGFPIPPLIVSPFGDDTAGKHHPLRGSHHQLCNPPPWTKNPYPAPLNHYLGWVVGERMRSPHSAVVVEYLRVAHKRLSEHGWKPPTAPDRKISLFLAGVARPVTVGPLQLSFGPLHGVCRCGVATPLYNSTPCGTCFIVQPARPAPCLRGWGMGSVVVVVFRAKTVHTDGKRLGTQRLLAIFGVGLSRVPCLS